MTTEGRRVWLPCPDDKDAWCLATISKTGEPVELTRLHAPSGVSKKTTMPAKEVEKLATATGVLDRPVNDLVALESVSDAAMLHTLRLRYEADDIYTAIGPVIVAVNPYKPVASCSAEAFASMTGRAEEELPPHCFRVGLSAYRGMVSEGTAQSILISGESGAGKTETTKLCMNVLAEVSSSSGTFTEMALESGIVLEAFGNAKTVYNNNSSRFGKWCSVHFDERGKMSACHLKSYLLEQSRVVGVSEGERSFHVFYHMLAGASVEEQAAFRLLKSCDAYSYTNGALTAAGIDDVEEWASVSSKLSVLGPAAEPGRLCVP